MRMFLAWVLTMCLVAVPVIGELEDPDVVQGFFVDRALQGVVTSDPTRHPTPHPSMNPTANPTMVPSSNPTSNPTMNPTLHPTLHPTTNPTLSPTAEPSVSPTFHPSGKPTESPTDAPTTNPTREPTNSPTSEPTENPTGAPTDAPSESPTSAPTDSPTPMPECKLYGKSACKEAAHCIFRKNAKQKCQRRTESPTMAPLPWTIAVMCSSIRDKGACLINDSCFWKRNKKKCRVKPHLTPQPTKAPVSPADVCNLKKKRCRRRNECYWNEVCNWKGPPTEKPTNAPFTLSPTSSPNQDSPVASMDECNAGKDRCRKLSGCYWDEYIKKCFVLGPPTSRPSTSPTTSSPTDAPTTPAPSQNPTLSPTAPFTTPYPTPGHFKNGGGRNILFIMMDDYRELKGDNVPEGLTPNIDALKDDSTEFLMAYCQYPQCGPSRASILTGRYPFTIDEFVSDLHSTHNYDENVTDDTVQTDWHSLVWLPKFFRNEGYNVGVAGKIFHTRSLFYPEEWFTEVDFIEDPQIGQDSFPFRVCDNSKVNCGCKEVMERSRLVCRDYVTKTLVQDWITRWKDEDRPWFIAAGFVRPHTDFRTASWARDKFKYEHQVIETSGVPDIARISWGDNTYATSPYANAVHFIDKYVGDLMDTLKTTNQYDDTVVILVSDHGMHLRDNSFRHFAKWTLFDASLHVPFIVKPPANYIATNSWAKKVDTVVELIDVFPTMAEFAQLSTAGLNLDGESVIPLMRGATEHSRGVAVSMMGVCARSKSGVRTQPCTTKARGGTGLQGVGYSIRTKEYRQTEWRSIRTDLTNCRSVSKQIQCDDLPQCTWLWFVYSSTLSANKEYYCIPNIGTYEAIDWTPSGLIAGEIYDNTQAQNLYGTSAIVPNHNVEYYMKQIWDAHP